MTITITKHQHALLTKRLTAAANAKAQAERTSMAAQLAHISYQEMERASTDVIMQIAYDAGMDTLPDGAQLSYSINAKPDGTADLVVTEPEKLKPAEGVSRANGLPEPLRDKNDLGWYPSTHEKGD